MLHRLQGVAPASQPTLGALLQTFKSHNLSPSLTSNNGRLQSVVRFPHRCSLHAPVYTLAVQTAAAVTAQLRWLEARSRNACIIVLNGVDLASAAKQSGRARMHVCLHSRLHRWSIISDLVGVLSKRVGLSYSLATAAC